jgi:hypothetical protein
MARMVPVTMMVELDGRVTRMDDSDGWDSYMKLRWAGDSDGWITRLIDSNAVGSDK